MIRATVKCKAELLNSGDTFPIEMPEIPLKGQLIVSQEEHFFEVVDVIWVTDKFQKVELIVNVVPMKSILCG